MTPVKIRQTVGNFHTQLIRQYYQWSGVGDEEVMWQKQFRERFWMTFQSLDWCMEDGYDKYVSRKRRPTDPFSTL